MGCVLVHGVTNHGLAGALYKVRKGQRHPRRNGKGRMFMKVLYIR